MIIHKVISNNSISMCGKSVGMANKSSRWVDVTCGECLKFARPYVIEKYRGEEMAELTEFKKKYPEYISLQEASRITGISPSKIRKLIGLGEINVIKHQSVHITFFLLSPSEVEVLKTWKDRKTKRKSYF